MTSPSRYDVAIIGGGHNALVAAAYLARAGHRAVVFERLDHVGGAAVSERPWAGVDARLSRYSYLVSLLPRTIIDDLGLRLTLRRRRYSSYTPDPGDPTRGVLVDTADAAATAASFARTTGDAAEADRFAAFYERLAPAASALFETVTQPLRRESAVRELVTDRGLWDAVVTRPLGELVRDALRTDLAQGIALTDGLIGTFSRADDPSLRQNRCFLYHVIGGGTGDWDVPVGGMGQVSGALERAARDAGAEVRTGTTVVALTPDGELTLDDGTRLGARLVISGVAPAVLDELLQAGGADAGGADAASAGGVPQPDASVAPEAAFACTFHVNETARQLDAAYDVAAGGGIPDPLPAEIYCHSLTDPSILSPELRAQGAQTLTLFGLQTPHRLTRGADPDALRADLLAAAMRSLDAVLDKPLEDVLYLDAHGAPCIEARTTSDLEASLAMPAGDIFHGPLSWPWATDDDPLDTPARRWGVATGHDRILMGGSGSRRGGAVSGLGGHSAAHAALEILR